MYIVYSLRYHALRLYSAMELSLCHKLWFSNPYILATQCRRPKLFQTMNTSRSNNLNLKYKRFTKSGCKDIGIKKLEFVAKTQFLSSDSCIKEDIPKPLTKENKNISPLVNFFLGLVQPLT